jgi:hypothetical protein
MDFAAATKLCIKTAVMFDSEISGSEISGSRQWNHTLERASG